MYVHVQCMYIYVQVRKMYNYIIINNNTQEAALALTMCPVQAEPVLHESSVMHGDNLPVTLPE